MRIGSLLLAATASLLVPTAMSQGANPVTIVVPFARGGGADFVARHLEELLPGPLGGRVALSHRPGEDGLVAADEVAKAAPDGKTLMLGSTASLIFAPLAVGRMPLDPTLDFEPIAVVSSVPRVLLLHPSLDVKNLDELVRLARERPGRLTCGTSDQLSLHAARLFERRTGVRLDCKHYEGGAALREEIVSGRRQIAFESFLLPEVQTGQLRALAVLAPSRMRALPDVPTASESGLPGVEAVAWHVLVAPKGTPPERVEVLARAVNAVLRQPAFVSALEARGYVVRPMTGAQMRRFLQREMALWRQDETPKRSRS